MNPIGGARALLGADGNGGVDWAAARRAAHELTDPGDLALSDSVRGAYAEDLQAAHREIQATAGIEFDLPRTIQVQNRHHWIEATLETLETAFEPLADRPGALPGITGPLNTASIAGSVAYLSRRVLGQYDPLLFAESEPHRLYVVHPNLVSTAAELDVPVERFRRWIAFHEVAHAAEFGVAPWLRPYLAERVTGIVAELATGSLPKDQYGELNRAMTVVEGYAELLMDEAFDKPSAELRRKLDTRRQSGGPLSTVVSRLLGLDRKREQYERGRAFFDAIVAERGLEAAGAVWDEPGNLPRESELEAPGRWLDRVRPTAPN
ncbi:zinc-dependent metalloprotease [Halodesulfurarchaeum formicicum]|uniref:Coenzyme F420 biosynthesis-associated protein n=1 Tax=Halodesulfurarchaeum formicicum TaxID=1873524 RepID=A0A1J1ABQ8_9EURY|nr:zinc-dependent metalloprotease [Halodesulfurarchaeum formicicum]APE95175.1 hypothetical protein HSR6_0716 [Halodesulfurarchaeum formicicum]